MIHPENDFIITMANILTGNQVDTAAVLSSLELICNGFSFDCSLVYEVDFSEQFCLAEHYAPHHTTFPENFAARKPFKLEQELLSKKTIFYIKKHPENSLLETQLLDMFASESLVLTPVTDEHLQIYGLAVFLNKTPKPLLSDSAFKVLSALLSMLVRYVGIRMYQKKLSQAQITLENILDNTGIDIYVNDFYTHDILYVNKSMAAPYGGQKKFIGKKCWQVLFPGQTGPCEFCPQTKLLDEHGLPSTVYSWDYQRLFDGAWFRVFSAAFYWNDGRLAHVVSSADITENKRNEAIIENLANYDQLTKLPNRRMLVKECGHRIDNATDTEQGYVLFFDIDGFKPINDKLGHDAGDEFLIQLGAFFSNIPLLKDNIYRNGGDEFVAIVGGEGVTKDNIRSLANFIHAHFKKPWNIKSTPIYCNISIGVACYPEDGITAEDLIQKADKAMYQVKKSGGGGLCFGYELAEASDNL